MKSVKIAVLFGALSLVFMGCPYESKVPVDSAVNAKADNGLAGKWEDKSDDSYKYKVSMDGSMYTIVKKAVKGDDEPTTYNGFLSDLEGTTFANIWEKSTDGGDPKYWIYKFEKKGDDRFTLYGMTNNVTEEFETSKDLKDFILKYQGLSFFWDKGEEKTFLKD
jgi:hypothetical protein